MLISKLRKMRFYVYTSVWGGHEDEEFKEWTIPFFEQAILGKFSIVLSDLTLRELELAPERIRSITQTIPDNFLNLVVLSKEAETLAKHNINEGALSAKFESNAQHIAISSIL